MKILSRLELPFCTYWHINTHTCTHTLKMQQFMKRKITCFPYRCNSIYQFPKCHSVHLISKDPTNTCVAPGALFLGHLEKWVNCHTGYWHKRLQGSSFITQSTLKTFAKVRGSNSSSLKKRGCSKKMRSHITLSMGLNRSCLA